MTDLQIDTAPASDLLGYAIWDFFRTGKSYPIRVRINGRKDEDLHPELFLRGYREMKGYERLALRMCKGAVLDVGAGAGAHSLVLQHRGVDVTALDNSGFACQVARERGVERVVNDSVMNIRGIEFNTILLLMNGLGLAGTEKETARLFRHLKRLLAKGGQIIGDSTDVLYSSMQVTSSFNQNGPYYGEVEFQLEYRGIRGKPFRWIYLDPALLAELADKAGLHCAIEHRDQNFHYLARMWV